VASRFRVNLMQETSCPAHKFRKKGHILLRKFWEKLFRNKENYGQNLKLRNQKKTNKNIIISRP
jgi:hypothetical protein